LLSFSSWGFPIIAPAAQRRAGASYQLLSPIAGFQIAERKFRINFQQSLRRKIAPAAIRRRSNQGNGILIGKTAGGAALEGTKSRWKRSPPRRAAARNAYSAGFARGILSRAMVLVDPINHVIDFFAETPGREPGLDGG
jgi:hypothetical protein